MVGIASMRSHGGLGRPLLGAPFQLASGGAVHREIHTLIGKKKRKENRPKEKEKVGSRRQVVGRLHGAVW
jgi:CelD/BcsL family acetyltransferase involved in cellulose biosynthesis